MLPERGEGCRCKGKTPKTFMYVCMYTESTENTKTATESAREYQIGPNIRNCLRSIFKA